MGVGKKFSTPFLFSLDILKKEWYNLLVMKEKLLQKIKEANIRKTTLRHYNMNISIWKGPQRSEHFIIFEEDKMEMLIDLLFINKTFTNIRERSVMGGKNILLWNIDKLWYKITNPRLVKILKEELKDEFSETYFQFSADNK